MNRYAKVLALSLAAVTVYGCEKQDKIDTGGVIITISEYDLAGIPAVMSAGGTSFNMVASDEASMTVRSQARNTNTPTSQLMDVLIEGYDVRFTRGDGGTAVPPRLTEPVGGLVPVNGTMEQQGFILMRNDQFESGPLRDMRIYGYDPETNSEMIRLVWHVKFFGQTISGERIETPEISFNLDVTP